MRATSEAVDGNKVRLSVEVDEQEVDKVLAEAVRTLSRQALTSWQERIHAVGRSGHIVLGVLLIAVSAAVLSGIDRSAEAFLLRISPQWLIHAAIRF